MRLASTDCLIHSSCCIESLAEVGDETRVGPFSYIKQNAKIGRGCTIGQNVFIDADVEVGNNVVIQNNVSLFSGILLEDDVICGPSMVFTNALNPRLMLGGNGNHRQTIVRQGATIGANATLLCGIEIGEYAFIGAGAVITGDVSPYSVMVGVPAQRTGWVSRAGHKLVFDEDGFALCPETGERYQLLSENHMRRIE